MCLCGKNVIIRIAGEIQKIFGNRIVNGYNFQCFYGDGGMWNKDISHQFFVFLCASMSLW